MSSIFQWPFKRKTYAGILNPRYVSDVQAANENTLDGLMNLAGMGGTDFYLFAGFAYTVGSPGTYGPGVFFLYGNWYYSTGLTEGQALNPTPTDTMQQAFGDGVGRNLYTLLQAVPVNAVVGGTTSPAFAGNMNASRIDNKTLSLLIASIQGTIARLGGAAFLNVGQTPGTVAAGDDGRFGYSQSQINTLFALKSTVLVEGSTNGNFVPTQPYDPATKTYVDASSSKRLASGTTATGVINNGGITVNISFGTTLANTNYRLDVNALSLGTPSVDATLYWPAVFNKTTTGCSVRLQNLVNFNPNLNLEWIVWGF